MNHQDLINTCIFEQIQGLLFSDLSGPLTCKDRSLYASTPPQTGIVVPDWH